MVLGSTHLVGQLSFSMLSSILTNDFDLIFGSFFFLFCGPIGPFFVWSTHIVEQLLFSMLSSILTFDYDLVLGSLFTVWGPKVLFLGSA